MMKKKVARKRKVFFCKNHIGWIYIRMCMHAHTDHYLDLHMSRIMLLTFWHIFLVLFNFCGVELPLAWWRLTCDVSRSFSISRSSSLSLTLAPCIRYHACNGVRCKWLYFVSCWCCQCRCLFASLFKLVCEYACLCTNAIHICVSRRAGLASDPTSWLHDHKGHVQNQTSWKYLQSNKWILKTNHIKLCRFWRRKFWKTWWEWCEIYWSK